MYFKDNAEKMCKRCTDGCKVCSNATDCQECVAPKMLEEGTMKCVEKCRDGFFNVDNKKCDVCMDNCMTCAAKEKCDKYKENYFMLDGKCVDMCPEKYFEKEGKCEKCNDTYNTSRKEGDTECEVCMNKSGTLKVLVCLDDCLLSYFLVGFNLNLFLTLEINNKQELDRTTRIILRDEDFHHFSAKGRYAAMHDELLVEGLSACTTL
ncbi:hypothetical protein EIN_295280 [Entamoeba invadens IP1]|uniref:Furin repeat-containing protein n=1 Tax=Entamoeba invadens IP1 TaxID=370355 RepID=L7FJP5_ENTIV|nr:hypothetical protein EIN_295280 [Entamoeba invadens IP1]ELP84364.1 hypothetical protein EIN_295280 [Entamoeba invadens IP1]|eukprot:XP_004183710.1 hypothetical protein EIN_295280 [Entamoeba invadens IP1]